LTVPRPHRARNIHHDAGTAGIRGGFRVALLLDGRERAEKELTDVGENGGAARGDAVLGEEQVEFAEGMMDAGGGSLTAAFVSEVCNRKNKPQSIRATAYEKKDEPPGSKHWG